MIGRVVEVAGEGRHLSLTRGFMRVSADGAEIGRVALDDIGVVVATARGLTWSNNLLAALAERGTGVVICAANFRPVAWLWPLEGHHAQAGRMEAQLDAPRPLGKRLWQAVVRAKIDFQAAVLVRHGRPAGDFDLLARRVRSGDPDNVEAQAARRYWPRLMGGDFRRDRDAPGANALLNYGYTVLRTATARAVVAAGLHPSVGIHHSNRGNPMRLADDLMEPFRPMVDHVVAGLVAAGAEAVDADAKRALAGVLVLDMATAAGTTPLQTCLHRLASSVAQSFEAGTPSLDLPAPPRPLDLPGLDRPVPDP